MTFTPSLITLQQVSKKSYCCCSIKANSNSTMDLYLSKGKPMPTQFSTAYSAKAVTFSLIINADWKIWPKRASCSNIFYFTRIFIPCFTLLLLLNSSAMHPKTISPLSSCPWGPCMNPTISFTTSGHYSRQLTTATTAAADPNFLSVGKEKRGEASCVNRKCRMAFKSCLAICPASLSNFWCKIWAPRSW